MSLGQVQHLHKVHTCTVLKEEDDSEYPVFSNTNPPLMANVKLNNAKLQMKVNMGVTLSIISEEDRPCLIGKCQLKLQFNYCHCGNH